MVINIHGISGTVVLQLSDRGHLNSKIFAIYFLITNVAFQRALIPIIKIFKINVCNAKMTICGWP